MGKLGAMLIPELHVWSTTVVGSALIWDCLAVELMAYQAKQVPQGFYSSASSCCFVRRLHTSCQCHSACIVVLHEGTTQRSYVYTHIVLWDPSQRAT